MCIGQYCTMQYTTFVGKHTLLHCMHVSQRMWYTAWYSVSRPCIYQPPPSVGNPPPGSTPFFSPFFHSVFSLHPSTPNRPATKFHPLMSLSQRLSRWGGGRRGWFRHRGKGVGTSKKGKRKKRTDAKRLLHFTCRKEFTSRVKDGILWRIKR